jgi:hypothetical protein
VIWVDPNGFREVVDPLEAEDAFISTGYLTFDYSGIKKFNVDNKVKYDWNKQRGVAAPSRSKPTPIRCSLAASSPGCNAKRRAVKRKPAFLCGTPAFCVLRIG